MYVYFLMLFLLYIFSCFLETYLFIVNIKFRSYSSNRRNYIIKNLLKSYILFFYSIIGSYYLYQGYILNNWNTQMLHNLGLVYSSIDMFGLLTIRKLPFSSIFHHTVVQILAFLHLYVQYPCNQLEINLLLLYTVCSSYSFMVNNYLGNRFIMNNNKVKYKIDIAYFSYILLCFVNWVIHYYYLIINFNNLNLPILGYYGLIHIIIYDDINLITFLKYNRNKLIRQLS
jgi:hypothetical protein